VISVLMIMGGGKGRETGDPETGDRKGRETGDGRNGEGR
jgi:hypothetical protein